VAAKEYKNLWEEDKAFKDTTSHFNRFTKDSILTFFGTRNGMYMHKPNVPNWMEKTEHGYELINVDSNNEVESRSGFFISYRLKPGMVDLDYTPGKGKAVAVWNYHVGVPNANEDRSIAMFSDDNQKHIICADNGTMYAIPCRMVPMGGSAAAYSQLRLRTMDDEFAHTPFVCLGFLMWLQEDEDEGAEVRVYLKDKMGWGFGE
jgi:hypothetical protein